MDIKVLVTDLLQQLDAFKSYARNPTPENQQDALTALDTIISTDRAMQQSIQAEMKKQARLDEMGSMRKELGTLDAKLKEFAERVLDQIGDTDRELAASKERLTDLKARLDS